MYGSTHWGSSNEYPQSVFWAEIRKISIEVAVSHSKLSLNSLCCDASSGFLFSHQLLMAGNQIMCIFLSVKHPIFFCHFILQESFTAFLMSMEVRGVCVKKVCGEINLFNATNKLLLALVINCSRMYINVSSINKLNTEEKIFTSF